MNIENFGRLNYLCKELGIYTQSDLELFDKHERRMGESLLSALERYFAEYRGIVCAE